MCLSPGLGSGLFLHSGLFCRELQDAVGDCEGRRRPKNRLQAWPAGESTMDREHSIDVLATIQNLLRQVAAERRSPRKASRTGGIMHRGVTRVVPYDRSEVLRYSEETGPTGDEFDAHVRKSPGEITRQMSH